MFDGYDSCSEDTSSSSSSEESEEEVAPLPSNLPIIKNNGQVYTYPDGKSGMGEYGDIYFSSGEQPLPVTHLYTWGYVLIPFLLSFPLEFLKNSLKKHGLKLTVLDKITGFVLDLFILHTYHLLVENK